VGSLYCALTALSVGAALRPADRYLVRLTGLVWLVFSVPHFIDDVTANSAAEASVAVGAHRRS
jgi:hypothetical protein